MSSLDKLTIGVGVTTPFGSVMRWPDDSPFRALTTFTALPLFDIKPTLAYQLHPDFSIGGGADIYTFASFFGEGQAELQSISPGGLAPAGSKLEFNGKGTAPGFNVGALYTALRNAEGQPVANVAVVYRSQATLHLDGALSANGVKIQDATTTLVLPQVITGGIALWPVRNTEREWKLELNLTFPVARYGVGLSFREVFGIEFCDTPQLAAGSFITWVGNRSEIWISIWLMAGSSLSRKIGTAPMPFWSGPSIDG